ncbi:hypothetical protein NDU88_005192 [Pleurodeles waltl]|uniref:Uncharacterized protein n=1 Tax=Pleurodeles waltl TaxID=8319 RepID=A0AAV7VKC8_PLEWA|nr:hypothetical protein NDU88_005192 [Pleurodeles waltl]
MLHGRSVVRRRAAFSFLNSCGFSQLSNGSEDEQAKAQEKHNPEEIPSELHARTGESAPLQGRTFCVPRTQAIFCCSAVVVFVQLEVSLIDIVVLSSFRACRRQLKLRTPRLEAFRERCPCLLMPVLLSIFKVARDRGSWVNAISRDTARVSGVH